MPSGINEKKNCKNCVKSHWNNGIDKICNEIIGYGGCDTDFSGWEAIKPPVKRGCSNCNLSYRNNESGKFCGRHCDYKLKEWQPIEERSCKDCYYHPPERFCPDSGCINEDGLKDWKPIEPKKPVEPKKSIKPKTIYKCKDCYYYAYNKTTELYGCKLWHGTNRDGSSSIKGCGDFKYIKRSCQTCKYSYRSPKNKGRTCCPKWARGGATKIFGGGCGTKFLYAWEGIETPVKKECKTCYYYPNERYCPDTGCINETGLKDWKPIENKIKIKKEKEVVKNMAKYGYRNVGYSKMEYVGKKEVKKETEKEKLEKEIKELQEEVNKEEVRIDKILKDFKDSELVDYERKIPYFDCNYDEYKISKDFIKYLKEYKNLSKFGIKQLKIKYNNRNNYYEKNKITPIEEALILINKYAEDYEISTLRKKLCKMTKDCYEKMRPKNCPECKAELQKEADFCHRCGASINVRNRVNRSIR